MMMANVSNRREGGYHGRSHRQQPVQGCNRMFLLSLLILPLTTNAIPMLYSINQRNTECLYDKVDAGEHMTMSVFVTTGQELRATAILEGP
eukprot:7128786-Ditylum_brightwellii.AAC.1